jgi:hypothetical protein
MGSPSMWAKIIRASAAACWAVFVHSTVPPQCGHEMVVVTLLRPARSSQPSRSRMLAALAVGNPERVLEQGLPVEPKLCPHEDTRKPSVARQPAHRRARDIQELRSLGDTDKRVEAVHGVRPSILKAPCILKES